MPLFHCKTTELSTAYSPHKMPIVENLWTIGKAGKASRTLLKLIKTILMPEHSDGI